MEQDDVISPDHYSHWLIEPIDFIMTNALSFWKGNVIKYVMRAGHKMYPNKNINESEVIDLQKVIRYCQYRIDEITLQEERENER